jgi:HNH endonuclease
MGFPPSVKVKALVASGRHCCICHKFCGLKIECHHIVQEADDGPNTFENCIPVCFDCHSDMRSYDAKHPRGTKYSAQELREHRDRWYTKVAQGGGASALSIGNIKPLFTRAHPPAPPGAPPAAPAWRSQRRPLDGGGWPCGLVLGDGQPARLGLLGLGGWGCSGGTAASGRNQTR